MCVCVCVCMCVCLHVCVCMCVYVCVCMCVCVCVCVCVYVCVPACVCVCVCYSITHVLASPHTCSVQLGGVSSPVEWTHLQPSTARYTAVGISCTYCLTQSRHCGDLKCLS